MSTPTSPTAELSFPEETAARRTRAELIGQSLRRGRIVRDAAFDDIYPALIRDVSPIQWTPLRVAARAVDLLELRAGERLLDVGAGVGKFCILAAARSRATVHGIERDPELVAIAREAVRRLGVTAEISEGSFDASVAVSYDAAYFFNPFALPLVLPGKAAFAATSWDGHADADVSRAQQFFERARMGMRIVTFCGFGGTVPAGYQLRARERWDGDWLELWQKGA